ncbi:MAG: protein kinase [Acidobacteriota bacterium]
MISVNGRIDALIGNTIDNKYRIESKLGEGGMGAVYLSTRLMIGDTVAVKILHSQQVSDPQAIERFRREAQAAARLKHQNAVIIYDFGVSNEGLVYLVMEVAGGQSLRDIIKQQGPVTPSAAAEIMSQVCAALDAAHRQNIVHRDLKPDNIIVSVTNAGLRAKVLDFGIAKMRDLTASNLTQTGAVMGTPYYMSPENCMGEELDHRSDIYSLGIVLFEMLAGVVPFNSPISTAVVVQHVNQAPPSLRALNASIPPAVDTNEGNYRLVQGTHVFDLRQEFSDVWADLGWPTYRDRRFRVLFKYDTTESKWKVARAMAGSQPRTEVLEMGILNRRTSRRRSTNFA